MFRSLPCLLCAVFVFDPVQAAFQIDGSIDGLRPAAATPTESSATNDATPVPGDCDLSMVVTPGDTLISIARQKLGSAARLGELLELNRDRVKNPDILRSGMTLRLPCDPKEETERQAPEAVAADSTGTAGDPAGAEAAEAAEITAEAPPAAEEPPVASGSAATACDRETLVRPGDTLGAIARQKLGSAARLGELLELNRDRVKNPDILRSGMTLRLPCDPKEETERQAPEAVAADSTGTAGVTSTADAFETESESETGTAATDAPPAIASAEVDSQAPAAKDSEEMVGEATAAGPKDTEREDAALATAGTEAVVTPAPVVAVDDRPPQGHPAPEDVGREQAGDAAADETDTADTTVRNLGGQPYATLSWGHDALWKARRGERLDNVLARWGQRAGYTVIIRDRYPWVMGVSYQRTGDFIAAVEDLLKGFATAGRSPGVTIYANNVMMLETR